MIDMFPERIDKARPGGSSLRAFVAALSVLGLVAAFPGHATAQSASPPAGQGLGPADLFGLPGAGEAPVAPEAASPDAAAEPPGTGDAAEGAAPDAVASTAPKRIVILGDNLAQGLAASLQEALSGLQGVTVENRARVDSGLVREDFYDWPDAVAQMVGEGGVAGAVMLVGTNDRQPIADAAGRHQPLSEPWRTAYRARIDAVLETLDKAGAEIYWVGLPPMSSSRLSSDMAALNEIFRSEVAAVDGTFVDIWDAFVDENGRYSASGPTLAGEIARLRAGDGVHFTRAGYEKLAHFIEREVGRDFESSPSLPDLMSIPMGTDAPPGPVDMAPPASLAAPSAPAAEQPTAAIEGPDEALGEDPAASDIPVDGPPTTDPAETPIRPSQDAIAPAEELAPESVPETDQAATEEEAGPTASPEASFSPERPLIGPIVPLTDATGITEGLAGPPSADSGLAGGEAPTARAAERERSAAPRPGRADDFTWDGNTRAN